MSRPNIPKEASFQFYSKPPNSDTFLRGRDEDRREIGVFSAKRYFNGDLFTQEQVFSDKECAPRSVSKARRSSRSALLKTRSRSRKQDKNRAVAIFNCSCTGKDSVDIDDDYVADKTTKSAEFGQVLKSHDGKMDWNHVGPNFLPTFCPGARNQPYGGGAFGTPLSILTPIHDFGKMSVDFEKKWGEEKMYYESDSDNSSDLFEIENLSRGYPVFSDDFSGDKKDYAPSEGSVEWSVITASAADNSDTTIDEYTKQGMMNNDNSKMRRKLFIKPNIFSGCKSDKAGGVVGNALRETKTSHRRLLPSSFRQLKVSDAGGIF